MGQHVNRLKLLKCNIQKSNKLILKATDNGNLKLIILFQKLEKFLNSTLKPSDLKRKSFNLIVSVALKTTIRYDTAGRVNH